MTTNKSTKFFEEVIYDPFREGVIDILIPTSAAQKEIWTSIKFEDDATLCYNETVEVNLEGNVNFSILEASINEVVSRHVVLQTNFSADGNFLLKTNKQRKIFNYTDLSGSLDAREKIENYKEKLQRTPVRIEKDALFHAYLFKVSERQFQLIIYAHHIVCDGWSYAIVLNELSEIYRHLVNGMNPDLNRPYSFKSYVEDNETSNNLLRRKSYEYWEKILGDYKKEFSFPTSFARKAFRTFESERLDRKINEDLVSKFKKICSKNGVSFYTGLISVYLILIQKISKNNDLIIGLSSATQPSLENNNLVGHLVNLLPYRKKISDELTFVNFMKGNKKSMLDAFENQFITFGELISKLKIERVFGEMPLISQVFNIDQQAKNQGIDFGNIKSVYKSVPRIYENFEIFINAVSRDNFLELECQFNKSLFDKELITNWLFCFEEIMTQVVQKNEIELKDIVLKELLVPQNILIDKKNINNNLTYDKKKYEIIKLAWEEVLLVDNIGPNDSFFKLGGHSLLAIELINKLSLECKVSISMKDIFDHPTLLELSSFVSTSGHGEQKVILGDRKYLKESVLTNSQMQIWYLEEIHHGTQMHNLPSAILLDELIDIKKLTRAFIKLINRHESFRTVVIKKAGRPIQHVLNSNDDLSGFKINFKRCSDLNEAKDEIRKESEFNFNKGQFPMFKVMLIHLNNGQSIIFFMVHHFIWDGWCFDIFFQELNLLYMNEEIELPEIHYSYLDYANWLHQKISNRDFDSSLEYWKTKLISELPILNLPIDFKRPKELTHEGDVIYFEIPNDLTTVLKKIAGDNNTSLSNLLLTALKISLLDLARENSDYESIIVGMPVRAREYPELLNVIGYFVNTVAIKTDIIFTQTFNQNLRNVSQVVLEALEHQQLPFQIVLSELNYDRNSGRSPIFQTFFSYQDVSNRDACFNNKKYSQVNVDKKSVHTEVDLWIKSSDLKTEGGFEYDVSLFKRETINNLKNNFINLLSSLVHNDGEIILNNIPLEAQMKDKLLFQLNTTEASFDKRPFFYLIDEVAKKRPDEVAVYDENSILTYRELKEKSDTLAFYLLNYRCDLVGISLNRCTNMLIAILAILKSGKGYVPIDPNFPEDRIDYMIDHSKIEVILTESVLSSRYLNKSQIINLDEVKFDIIQINNLPNVLSSQTAYVIYTSGSTGHPKGVELSHLSVSNFLAGMDHLKICTEKDKVLAVTTLSFDIAVLELYLPLIVGASVYIAKTSDVMDGKKIRTLIEELDITVMQATPTTWRLLLQSEFTYKKDLTILCGGESFPIDLAEKLVSKVKRVLNMYGPTETTVWSSVKELSKHELNITIGRPIINTTFYILDDHLRLVPFGAVGQLFIGGTGLAKGYLYRPDLTSERFIQNPYNADEIIYATGDLARYNSDGEVICLGRNDGQVKVRGFRIELGEIESVIQKVSSINECTCVVHDFGGGDKRIIAYYSIKDKNILNENQLKLEVSKSLPGYMVPSHFFHLELIPKTPNGKIDKKSLPKNHLKKEIDQSTKIKENSHLEIVESGLDGILFLCKKVLNKSDLKLSDNFFEVGGNSIIAVELMVQIAEKYGLDMQLSVLLESKDIKDFGERVFKNNERTFFKSDKWGASVPHVKNLFKSLVTIKDSGDSTPIICFHGVGGNVLNYISLLPAIDQGRSLFAFQSIGLNGEDEPLSRIEDMALQYYRELKLLRPKGPYILAGGSMGGLIALEVARRITEQGDIVEKLIMFDTFGPNFDLQTYSSPKKISFLKRFYQSIYNRIKVFFNLILVRLRRNLGIRIPTKALLVEIEYRNYQAIWSYHPKVYSGNLILIRSNLESNGWYSDPNLGWDGIIDGKIEKHYIDSDHEHFIESLQLIEILKKILK